MIFPPENKMNGIIMQLPLLIPSLYPSDYVCVCVYLCACVRVIVHVFAFVLVYLYMWVCAHVKVYLIVC